MNTPARQTISKALAGCDEQMFVSALDTYYGRMLRFTRVFEPDARTARSVVWRAWQTALRDGAPPEAFPSLDAWLFSLTRQQFQLPLPAPEPAGRTDVDRALFEEEGNRWAGHWRDDGMPEPWDEAGAGARIHVLEQGLRALPAMLAALLVLHDVEELGGAEITAVLGITRETQMALLHRARTMLQRTIDKAVASAVAS